MSAQAPCAHGLTEGDERAPFGKAALQVSTPHALLPAVGQAAPYCLGAAATSPYFLPASFC